MEDSEEDERRARGYMILLFFPKPISASPCDP